MTRVYQVDNPNFANITVEVVRSPALADVAIYRNDAATSVSLNETTWTFVNERHNAHLAIYMSSVPRGNAHLRVAFVSNPSFAGWLKRHKLRGRLRHHHPELEVR